MDAEGNILHQLDVDAAILHQLDVDAAEPKGDEWPKKWVVGSPAAPLIA